MAQRQKYFYANKDRDGFPVSGTMMSYDRPLNLTKVKNKLEIKNTYPYTIYQIILRNKRGLRYFVELDSYGEIVPNRLFSALYPPKNINYVEILNIIGSPYPPEVVAFINAAGITDTTQISALVTLVESAKSNSWWDKCKAIYPFVGGTANSHKYNLKDPRDANDAFRLTFSGNFTHSSTGIKGDGSTAWAQTYLSPSTSLSLTSTALSYYTRDIPTFNRMAFSGSNISNDRLFFYLIWASNVSFYDCYGTSGGFRTVSVTALPPKGFYMGSRTSSIDSRIYRNGVQSGVTQTNLMNNNITSASLQMFRQDNGTLYNNTECAFATIGDGINSTLALTMYNDVQTFQTALGRAV